MDTDQRLIGSLKLVKWLLIGHLAQMLRADWLTKTGKVVVDWTSGSDVDWLTRPSGWVEVWLTSKARAEPVVVAVQQSVQDAGKDGDVVFAVIGQRLSMPLHRAETETQSELRELNTRALSSLVVQLSGAN